MGQNQNHQHGGQVAPAPDLGIYRELKAKNPKDLQTGMSERKCCGVVRKKMWAVLSKVTRG